MVSGLRVQGSAFKAYFVGSATTPPRIGVLGSGVRVQGLGL